MRKKLLKFTQDNMTNSFRFLLMVTSNPSACTSMDRFTWVLDVILNTMIAKASWRCNLTCDKQLRYLFPLFAAEIYKIKEIICETFAE